MAYKDEYEVARLYTDGTFAESLRQQFAGDFRLEFHLAPPLLAERDPASGHLRKKSYGRWVLRAFRLLAHLRFLRGSMLDPFGHTAERKRERALIEAYRATIAELLPALRLDNYAIAVALARLPERIRGYGHIKDKAVADAQKEQETLLAAFRTAPAPHAIAAE
jgi:indolepyruvate ferredoxin oxidoreductase